jgi:hypothetical protein
VTYRTVKSWLPVLPARFDAVIDNVARKVTARPATPAMITAATTFTGLAASTQIRRTDDLSRARLVKVLSVILDSPAHMSR